jgi:hypothetical protein
MLQTGGRTIGTRLYQKSVTRSSLADTSALARRRLAQNLVALTRPPESTCRTSPLASRGGVSRAERAMVYSRRKVARTQTLTTREARRRSHLSPLWSGGRHARRRVAGGQDGIHLFEQPSSCLIQIKAAGLNMHEVEFRVVAIPS